MIASMVVVVLHPAVVEWVIGRTLPQLRVEVVRTLRSLLIRR